VEDNTLLHAVFDADLDAVDGQSPHLANRYLADGA